MQCTIFLCPLTKNFQHYLSFLSLLLQISFSPLTFASVSLSSLLKQLFPKKSLTHTLIKLIKIIQPIEHFNPQKSHVFIIHQDLDSFISLLIKHVLKVQSYSYKNFSLPLSHQYTKEAEPKSIYNHCPLSWHLDLSK